MKYVARFDGEEREFVFEETADGLACHSGGRTFALDLSSIGDGDAFSLLVDGRSYAISSSVEKRKVVLHMLGERFVVEVEDDRERAAHAAAGHRSSGKRELLAAMPGIVVDIKVAVGDEVDEGQALVVLEAMKMQNPLSVEAPGKVTAIRCKPGEAVAAGAVLLELE